MKNQSFNDFASTHSNFQSSTNHFQNPTIPTSEIENTLSASAKQSFSGNSPISSTNSVREGGRGAYQKTQSGENGFVKNNRQGKVSFSKNSGKYNFSKQSTKRTVLSVSQILARANQKKQRRLEQKKRKKPFKPIIPPKSFILLFKDKPEKYIYNRRIIDYKHCGLLQRYIGLGGKILPRRQTKLTAKQQRYVAKTIKSARIMGLLPFVTKERGFFR
jgi:small subunit ribosomal protein S18